MLQSYLTVAAIIVGIGIVQFANGIIQNVLPLHMTVAGFPPTAVGLMVTAHPLGFLAGCVLVPRMVRSVGHIRAFTVFAAATAITTLAFAIATNTALWASLRLSTGFCSAGLFTVAESWLNDQAPGAMRGRVIGAYMLTQKLAFAGGALLLGLGDVRAPMFLMAGSAAYSLSLIPVALTRAPSPPVPKLVTLGMRRLYRIAPAAALGCAASGMVNTAVLNLTPVYGARLGLPVPAITVLMAALQVGSLVLQWPLGWLSDRMDRRYVIVGCSAAVALLSAVLALAGGASAGLLYGLFAIWGGFGLSIYGLCIGHANDGAEPEIRVALSSSLLFAWAAGGVAGPTVAAGAIDLLGPAGLFVFAATASTGFTLFVAWRMVRRPAVRPPPRPAGEASPVGLAGAASPLPPRSGSAD